MQRDIRTFVETLRREGELVIIDAEVDPNLELAEVHRRVIAAGGPALLFTNPKGYNVPVVTNLFGTTRRVDLAFGPRPERFVERAVRLMHELVPPTLGKLWAERDFFWQGMNVGMRQSARGPVTEVIDTPPRIDRLPMVRSWPQDGGDFVTLPLVYTEHPDDGRHNLGMYRIQRHSPSTTGMHWQIGKGGGFHHHVARERGEDLPVTLFVGGPPALIVSAIAPLPENVPELLLASLLMGERLPRCDNPVGPHPLISGCEFAFVGYVKPNEVAPEGPFGDHYGYYSYTHDYPVFNVKALCHRREPIWPATIVGKPRQEDLYIGDYLQKLLSPIFPVVMPNVRDLWSYGETGYHSLAGAVVQERFKREAVAAAFRILGEGQLALTKFLWVVDQPIDLRDPKAVLTTLLARFRPETDLYVISNLSMDTLDYTGPDVNLGSKGVMLGVGEPWRALPREVRGPLPGGVTTATVYCPGVLLVGGPSHAQDPDMLARAVAELTDWPLVIAVDDPDRVAASDVRFLWTVFTRFEPAADIHATRTRVVRHHVVYEGTIGIDARSKEGYAEELFVDDVTRRTVDDRWAEYFPGGKVSMGDADHGHLDE
ncbi:MAG: UbiD family decarboxylase [Myxococcota bacterium]|jgi:UbiD family decarboxylase